MQTETKYFVLNRNNDKYCIIYKDNTLKRYAIFLILCTILQLNHNVSNF